MSISQPPPDYEKVVGKTVADDGTDLEVADYAAIPKGTIDPVYEAKAQVLNHAVTFSALR